MSYTSISPHDARIQQQQGVPLIDIRQPDEFRREHLPMPSPCRWRICWLVNASALQPPRKR